jgi:hypothetical protein
MKVYERACSECFGTVLILANISYGSDTQSVNRWRSDMGTGSHYIRRSCP